MEKFKNIVIKFAISGIAVFVFGILIGYQLNIGKISSIQGYLFSASARASNSNASNSNASNSNASNSNASNSNASNSNASSSNASITDNIIYLQNFALGSTSAKQGDRVNVTLRTTGACNSGASIVFKGDNGASFTVQVHNITGVPYIIVPSLAVATKYSVTDVLLVGRNSNNSTFTKQYSISGTNNYYFNSYLNVTTKDDNGTSNGEKVTLNSISLDNTSAKVSEKVYLKIETSKKLTNLRLVFTSADGNTFTVYAKDLTEKKPYFEIPSSTVVGTYSLTSAIIYTSNGSAAYSKDGENDTEKFDFNSTLEISEGNEKTFIYNNEDVTSDVLTKLYNAPSGSEIIINADSSTLINEELFNTIKGKNKKLIISYKDNQIVFDGRDITTPKTIDITMTVENVSNNEEISKLVSEGIIVNFPDNGNLPGKALIGVKATEEVEKVLNDNVFVYIYNKSTNNFCEVDTDVEKNSDGYYEFTITHNSDYLITNSELDSKLVVAKSDDNVVSFLKGDLIYLLLIAIGVVVIVAVIIFIMILKKKSISSESNKTNDKKDNDKNESKE